MTQQTKQNEIKIWKKAFSLFRKDNQSVVLFVFSIGVLMFLLPSFFFEELKRNYIWAIYLIPLFISVFITFFSLTIVNYLKFYQNVKSFVSLEGDYNGFTFVHKPDEILKSGGTIERHKTKQNGTTAQLKYIDKNILHIFVDVKKGSEKGKKTWEGIIHMDSKYKGLVSWKQILWEGKKVSEIDDVYINGLKEIGIFYDNDKKEIYFHLNEIQNKRFGREIFKKTRNDTTNTN